MKLNWKNTMKRIERFLAIVGLCDLGMGILAVVFDLKSLMTLALVVFFVCVVGVMACTVLSGYNPVER